MPKRLSLEAYQKGILEGDRFILGRAISLIESQLSSDIDLSQKLIEEILKFTGKSIRIGITGSPGVGKSTFIESFGSMLIEGGKKMAVLAIDPTGQKTRGSIMGDKTRMNRLSQMPSVFIRPSPSGGTLGGVAQKTRETMLMCEAAGYNIILVETLGVGQSEVAVRQLVDCFLLLLLAGGGDQLQGIKKGIMELADILVITKADGPNMAQVRKAQAEYSMALKYLRPQKNRWKPVVLTCSALENINIDKVWRTVTQLIERNQNSSFFFENRKNQNLAWLKTDIETHLITAFYKNPKIQIIWKKVVQEVKNNKQSVYEASKQLRNTFDHS